MLFRWAGSHPDKPYLFQPIKGVCRPYTWSEVANQVRRVAGMLKTMLPRGSRVAISGRNTAHWFICDLAISMAGMVSVGLYPKQAPANTRYILEHSDAKLVFVGPAPDIDEFMAAIPDTTRTCALPYSDVPPCDLQWDEFVSARPLSEVQQFAPDATMTLVYTSGTTGKPKGVVVTYENMTFAAIGLLEALPPHPSGERLFSYLPLAHAFERGAVELTSLYFGAEVHFLGNIDLLSEQLPQVAPTRFYGVPLVYARMQAGVLKSLPQGKLERLTTIPIVGRYLRRRILAKIGLHKARMCFSGSAPLPLPIMEWFQRWLGLEILQGYGMTENTIYATVNRPGANRMGSVGQEMPGANLRIAEDGEILFRHPGVMPGYYRDPDKTRESFTADGYLRTGDKGRIDRDGYLYITGRVKDIFKTLKGKYVAPAPIEGAMARNVDIDQLCLVGSGLKQPVLIVSITPAGRAKSRGDLEKQLIADMDAVNETLEDHEKIAKCVLAKDAWTIDNGLLNPTMKVRRSEVESRYAGLVTAVSEDRSRVARER